MVERLPGRGEVKALGKIDFLEACRDQIIVLIGKAVKKPVAAAVRSHDGASGAYPASTRHDAKARRPFFDSGSRIGRFVIPS
ncbi:hypothetical protein [Rhizobium sp. 42MFCr.1]|jgi:hypothetical protein|uniref:hypothetical protein n=1 Tax=Rhizobium sp. 42MFCr.1 TaxID=1048680 RepID=UPI00047861CA|nr:hypothetical protein [Rhizobium sp. 42MFCr.1]